MSKTYRKSPFGIIRKPKGHKQARINNARSVPPSSWEDIPHNRECWVPLDIAIKLLVANKPEEIIFKKLKKKFHLQSHEILEIIDDAKNMLKRKYIKTKYGISEEE